MICNDLLIIAIYVFYHRQKTQNLCTFWNNLYPSILINSSSICLYFIFNNSYFWQTLFLCYLLSLINWILTINFHLATCSGLYELTLYFIVTKFVTMWYTTLNLSTLLVSFQFLMPILNKLLMNFVFKPIKV